MAAIYVKEKSLLYGGSNSGKTHALLRFATEVLNAGKRVFIIDADDGCLKLIAEMDEFDLLRGLIDTPRFTLRTVYDWNDAQKAVNEYQSKFKPKPGDLIGVEMVNNHWDWAQAEFVEQTKHKSVAELQLEKIETGRLQFGGLDGKSEWPIIKGLYFNITTPTLQSPAHVIWTASAKGMPKNKDGSFLFDDGPLADLFGSVGVRNDGQKDVHYKMDTVFYLAYDYDNGNRTFTTLKERGKRARLRDIAYTDLFTTYYALHDLSGPWVTE